MDTIITTTLRTTRVAQFAFLAVEPVHALGTILTFAARGTYVTLSTIPVAITFALGHSVAVQGACAVLASAGAAVFAMQPCVAPPARALPAHLIALCTAATCLGASACNTARAVACGPETLCAHAARLITVKARFALASAVPNICARAHT